MSENKLELTRQEFDGAKQIIRALRNIGIEEKFIKDIFINDTSIQEGEEPQNYPDDDWRKDR